LCLVGDDTIGGTISVDSSEWFDERTGVEVVSFGEAFVDVQAGSTRIQESVDFIDRFSIWGFGKEGDFRETI